MKMVSFLSLGMLLCAPGWAQPIDNAGREFFIGFMPNTDTRREMTTELHLTSDITASVSVQYPAINPTFTATVVVGPGAITIVDLGAAPAFAWTPGAVDSNGVWAVSEQQFVAYAVNRRETSTDATVALPVDALGTEYIVHSYRQHYEYSAFTVVAVHDETTVTIVPTADLIGGYAAGVPFSIILNRGEGFLGRSLGDSLVSPTADLTGTIVEASQPIQLSNGHTCASVPTNWNSCDHLFEVAQPVSSWGYEAIAAPLPLRPYGSFYRILASEDQTTVQQNGSVIATLDRGEFVETPALVGPQVFQGNRPISVVQIITSVGFPDDAPTDITGDPSMLTVLPSDQYLQRYTFSTVGGRQFADDFVSIIAEHAEVAAGTVLLDGSPVPATDFSAIPGTDYSYAILPLTDGTHTTSSSAPHGITVEGFDGFDTYLYAGGATFASPTTTSIPAEAPARFGLEQNYPNPFDASTRISFHLAETTPVSLKIYDVTGRAVATLVQQVLPEGRHEIPWHGRDAAGHEVPSGMYLYRIETDRFAATQRMTLLR